MAPFLVRRMLHAVTCRFGIQHCNRGQHKEFCSTCLVFLLSGLRIFSELRLYVACCHLPVRIQDCKRERLVLSSFHRLKKILEIGRQDTIKTQIVQYMKSETLDSIGACCKFSLAGLGPRIVNVSDIHPVLGLV